MTIQNISEFTNLSKVSTYRAWNWLNDNGIIKTSRNSEKLRCKIVDLMNTGKSEDIPEYVQQVLTNLVGGG